LLVVEGWPGTTLLAFERGETGGDEARARVWSGKPSSGIDSVGVTLRIVGPRMYSSRRRSRAAICVVLSGVPVASLLLRLSRDCSMADGAEIMRMLVVALCF
jgi:hypothetical protein